MGNFPVKIFFSRQVFQAPSFPVCSCCLSWTSWCQSVCECVMWWWVHIEKCSICLLRVIKCGRIFCLESALWSDSGKKGHRVLWIFGSIKCDGIYAGSAIFLRLTKALILGKGRRPRVKGFGIPFLQVMWHILEQDLWWLLVIVEIFSVVGWALSYFLVG